MPGASASERRVGPMTRKSLRAPLWTAEELQQLRELAAAGASISAIARKLKRTYGAVLVKAKSEGIAVTKIARNKREKAEHA